MVEDILSLIRENVIQGRVTRDDEGLDERFLAGLIVGLILGLLVATVCFVLK